MEKASFLNRLIAWIIDQIIVVILSFLVAAIAGLLLGVIGQATGGLPETLAFLLSLSMMLPIFLLPFLYYGYFWSAKGQSIGMGMMNIKVIYKSGEDLSFLRAGLRGTIGYWMSGLIMGLGYLWVLFDREKEAWHDKIFLTAVIEGKIIKD